MKPELHRMNRPALTLTAGILMVAAACSQAPPDPGSLAGTATFDTVEVINTMKPCVSVTIGGPSNDGGLYFEAPHPGSYTKSHYASESEVFNALAVDLTNGADDLLHLEVNADTCGTNDHSDWGGTSGQETELGLPIAALAGVEIARLEVVIDVVETDEEVWDGWGGTLLSEVTTSLRVYQSQD